MQINHIFFFFVLSDATDYQDEVSKERYEDKEKNMTTMELAGMT
jgi:hypothetical protein